MYSYAVPSMLRAWLGDIILLGRNAAAEDHAAKNTPTVVIASRGSSYAPGT